MRRSLRQAARRLHVSFRATFLLWVKKPDISYRELSRRTGVPINTVSVRLYRARRTVRAMPLLTRRLATTRPQADGGR